MRQLSAAWLLPYGLLPFGLLAAACCGEATQRSVVNNASPHGPPPVSDSHQADDLARDRDIMHGEASYYADFFDGRKTASGERYDPDEMTAANRTLPLGTKVRIRRVDNGRSVVVRVNDRGPFGKRRRIFDLSKAAAEELDMLHVGKAEIEAVVID